MIKYSVGNILHSFRNTKNVNVIMVNIIKYIFLNLLLFFLSLFFIILLQNNNNTFIFR